MAPVPCLPNIVLLISSGQMLPLQSPHRMGIVNGKGRGGGGGGCRVALSGMRRRSDIWSFPMTGDIEAYGMKKVV